MHACKITVLKRAIFLELAEFAQGEIKQCERFYDGQEFLLDGSSIAPPPDFCPWAWADLRSSILAIMSGGNLPWSSRPGLTITCCTDGIRPVVFKVERLD